MYTVIKGIYENGQVILEESLPTLKNSRVVVMLIGDEEKPTEIAQGFSWEGPLNTLSCTEVHQLRAMCFLS